MLRLEDCDRDEVEVEGVDTGTVWDERSDTTIFGWEAPALPVVLGIPSGKLSFALNPRNLIAAASNKERKPVTEIHQKTPLHTVNHHADSAYIITCIPLNA